MEFVCRKKDLEKYIDVLSSVAPNNPSLPIIQNALFEIESSVLSITTTNLDFGVKQSIPVKTEEKESQKFAVPIKVFSKIIKSIKTQEHITLEFKDTILTIKTDQESINIITQPTEDFPKLPAYSQENSAKIEPNKLTEGFKSVMFAAAVTNIKPELSSVYVYNNQDTQELVFVSTDQFRLSEKKLKSDSQISNDIIIPISNVGFLVTILQKLSDPVEMYFDEGQMVVKTEELQVYSRVVDASFPDYKQIIPNEYKTKIVMLKSDLANILSKTSVFTDKYGKITFDVSSKKLTITAKNETIGEIKHTPNCSVEGEDIKLSFNYKYIQGTLNSLTTDSVSLEFSGQTSPLIIKPVGDDSYLYLVMPMVE